MFLIQTPFNEPHVFKRDVTYVFDRLDQFPNNEVIPEGTTVHLDGVVSSTEARRFLVYVDGQKIGDQNFSQRWNFDWESKDVKEDVAHFEVDWAAPGDSTQKMAEFDVHILHKNPLSISSVRHPDGSISVTWDGKFPKGGCYAQIMLDGNRRGSVIADKALEIPRTAATPGKHLIGCRLFLPHGLEMDTDSIPFEVENPAWLVLKDGKSKWIIDSDNPVLPEGSIKTTPGFQATARRLYVNTSPVDLSGPADGCDWKVPFNLIKEGNLNVSGECVDTAGDALTTPAIDLDVEYAPAYAATRNERDVIKIVDGELLPSYQLLSLLSGWKDPNHPEAFWILRKDQIVTVGAGDRQQLDESLLQDHWGPLSYRSKEALDRGQIDLSKSLTKSEADDLHGLLAETRHCIDLMGVFAQDQFALGNSLPGDDPWDGYRTADERDARLLASRTNLKTIVDLAGQMVAKRNALQMAKQVTPSKLTGGSLEQLLSLWTARNLPKMGYLEWLKDLYHDSEIGTPNEYPLTSESQATLFVDNHSPSELNKVAEALSSATLVQHWDLRGLGTNKQGLTNVQGERLNNSRKLLSQAYADLAKASDLKHNGVSASDGDTGESSEAKFQRLIREAVGLVERSRGAAQDVRSEL